MKILLYPLLVQDNQLLKVPNEIDLDLAAQTFPQFNSLIEARNFILQSNKFGLARPIINRYESVCYHCFNRISFGSKIMYLDDHKLYFHLECWPKFQNR